MRPQVLYGADLDSSDVGSGFPRGPPLGDRWACCQPAGAELAARVGCRRYPWLLLWSDLVAPVVVQNQGTAASCLAHALCSDSAYASDPWNLSVLPRQAGHHSSLLRVLDGHIAGEPAALVGQPGGSELQGQAASAHACAGSTASGVAAFLVHSVQRAVLAPVTLQA